MSSPEKLKYCLKDFSSVFHIAQHVRFVYCLHIKHHYDCVGKAHTASQPASQPKLQETNFTFDISDFFFFIFSYLLCFSCVASSRANKPANGNSRRLLSNGHFPLTNACNLMSS